MRAIRTFALIGLLFASTAMQAAPLGSAFTYQGQLEDGGIAANGFFDLQFTPYADATTSTPLGPAVVVEDVQAIEGLFSARVDFGAGFFQGDQVWLEVGVRPAASVGAFDALNPRQELTATPYALKPALDSITELELASNSVAASEIGSDAVGNDELAPNAVTTTEIVDGTVQPQDLANAAFNGTFWRVGGNSGTTGSYLGTSDGAPLELRSDVGVTLHGARFNNNTELTVRGLPGPVETNADLTLWPRGGQAFFNLSALGTSPADSRFLVHSVGTSPFTGYLQRLLITGTGSFGFGQAATVTTANSVAFADGVNGPGATASADNQFLIRAAGGVSVNALPLSDVELTVAGGASSASDDADLALIPRNPTSNRSWALSVDKQNGTSVTLDYSSPTQSIVLDPRFRLTSDGSLGVGDAFNLLHAGSFVFADGSSATAVATTGANQFLVRAVGGIGVNRDAVGGIELAIESGSTTAGGEANLSFYPAGNDRSYRFGVGGTTAANTSMLLSYSDPGASEFFTRLVLRPNGFMSINPASNASGSYILPGFPLTVGTAGDTTNGNGARVTAGGVWTNGSSRTFKEAFAAIDPEAVLERVIALPIATWRYKGSDPTRHMGPVAEDFHAAFGLGEDERYIGTIDADGVALAAVQGLNARLEREAENLQAENRALRASLSALEARLQALETRNATR